MRIAKPFLLALALVSTPVLAEEAKSGSDTPTEATFHQQGALFDRSPQHRPQMLSVFVGSPYGYYYYGGFPFGLGARYQIPILHDGFIPAVNDSFEIEFGLDFSGVVGYAFYPTLGIPVELMWQFHFTKKFSAYVKVGAVLEINFVPYYCNFGGCGPGYGPVGVHPIGNLGIIYKFTEKVSFRAEAGYPWVKVGLGFDL